MHNFMTRLEKAVIDAMMRDFAKAMMDFMHNKSRRQREADGGHSN